MADANTSRRREASITRKVAFGAGAIFVLAAILLSYISYSKAMLDLADTAAQSALSLNRLFANLVWPGYSGFAATASVMTREEILAHGLTRTMLDDVRELSRGTRILKVKLFDRAGVTIFSTETAQIGTNSYTSDGLQAALADRIDCRLGKRPTFESTDGPVFDRWIVSCYLPIHDDAAGTRIAAIMEVYSDATESHSAVMEHVGGQTAIFVAILAAAFLTLMAVVRHAEREIAYEHRRRVEIDLAREEAESSSRTKSAFLANMSHELRTPLNAIIGFAQMIREQIVGPIGNARYRDYAGHIDEAGQHLLSIINDVLDLSKVEVGKMRLDNAPTDAAAVALSALQMMEAGAAAGSIALVSRIEPGLPQAHLDANKLRQILLNLLSNAVKFTQPGGQVELAVGLAPTRTGAPRLRFAVRDTGVGMNEADVATALRPFGQVDNPMTRRAGGTGLGLPLAKDFAELMGGSLVIESAPGRGTTVHVELPVDDASAATEASRHGA